jgi:uncharacterized repeat protein (TIGR01451 family)
VISGTVYRDADRNGTQNGSDVGIANVSVELRDAGNALVATTTTDGSGAYSFPAQPAGSYSVVETQPTAYQSGPENASNTVAVVLVAGTPSTVNFGESAGSFTGIVFLDGNHDGVQDGGEIGLPGVSVALTGTDVDATAVNRTATTNASGVYTFNDVLAGTYTITETQPAVFGDGLDVLGAGNVGGTAGNDVYSAIALTAGTQASGYNFAEEGSAVTGVVFRDANRDGTQQGSDIGLNNVTITLRDNSNVVIGTTTTAADGSYLFGGVPSGNYTVTETQPAGYGSAVTSPDVVNIVVPAGGAATAHFADTVSTLSGSVFIDLDNDGVRDAGEAGVAAINISLTGTDAAGAAVNRTAATDASGNFIFTNVLTPNGGGYTLSEPVQPAAFADGQDAVGTAGGTLANDSISAIALPFNTDATGYTFGELGTTISGVVFKDVNVNGTHEGGDVPLPGITISLHDALNNSVGTTTTAADGTYSFAGLPAGNYVVTESQPAGYGSNSPDSVSVTLAPGGSGTADFAEITSSIAGFVWSDTDNDSTRDAGEPGIANVLITLTGIDAAGQTVNRTAHTDGTGAYLFDDVLGGTYTLSETQPADYADGTDVAGSVGGTVANDSISNIVLPVSTHATAYAFGELGQSITGHVWLDSNRDGQFALSENGIATVTINLRDAANAIVDTKITDAGGVYGFANIPAGHYTIEEVQPLGYGSSTPDTVATDLVAGGTHAPIDFGDTAGSIAGLVYNDTNNNGIRDAGEPAIPAVQIALSGTDARGVAVNVQATSGMDGTYRFSDVVGGTYTLTETQPAAYGDGIDVAGTSGGTVANDVISAIALGAQVDATGYAFAERGLSATISGRVWRDPNHDRRRDADESLLANWSVELYQGTTLLQTVATDANGAYRLQDVAPGSGYEIRFREPVSHSLYGAPVTNESGASIAPGAVGPNNPGGGDPRGGTLTGLLLEPNASIEQQSLPVDPSGVVYDSVSRKAIAGASVTISGPNGFDAATQLLGGDANATQITNELGLYQFWLLPNAPAGTYTIAVTPPPGRYTPGVSALIPPCSNALNVGAVPAPAVVQNASTPPASSVPNQDASQCPSTSAQLAASAETTQYFYSLALTPGISANVINNNLPVDPILGGALAVTKTTPMVNVSRGDLVPYTITVTNTLNALLTNVDIRDLLPPGFVYRTGTGSVNGQTLEPQRIGRQLTWIDQSFTPHERKTYKLILVVGSGVGEADYVNQAFALNNLIGATISNVATAAVRVVPDPVFDCGDLIGKVFDDRNVNGYQDQDEPGIANVRLVTLNGVLVTTDAEGRYHIACAMIPNEVRGSTFVVKLDERTLPSGFRVTTENPGDVRLTRGKLAKLNFGATIHRVIRIELDDGAFESGKQQLRKEWLDRVVELNGTLAEKPSVVRIAYPTSADARLQKRRKKWVIKQLREQWSTLQRGYPLEIEDEAGARK